MQEKKKPWFIHEGNFSSFSDKHYFKINWPKTCTGKRKPLYLQPQNTEQSESSKIYCGVEQLVARWAHNPKVVSSSLAPATTKKGCKNLQPFFVFIPQRIKSLFSICTLLCRSTPFYNPSFLPHFSILLNFSRKKCSCNTEK